MRADRILEARYLCMTVRWFSVSRAARERRGLGSDEAEGFGSEGQRGEERE
jgi:hypothetical protein